MRSQFRSVMVHVAKNTMFVKAPSTIRSIGVFSKIHSAFLKRNSSDTPAELVMLALLIFSGTLQNEGTTAIKIKQRRLTFVKVLCKVSNGINHTLEDTFVCLAKSKLNVLTSSS